MLGWVMDIDAYGLRDAVAIRDERNGKTSLLRDIPAERTCVAVRSFPTNPGWWAKASSHAATYDDDDRVDSRRPPVDGHKWKLDARYML